MGQKFSLSWVILSFVLTVAVFCFLQGFLGKFAFLKGALLELKTIVTHRLIFRPTPNYEAGSVAATLSRFWFYGAWLMIFFFVPDSIRQKQIEKEQNATSVYCAKCDQYLGTASSFKTPCPLCGSNRYVKKANF